MAERVGTIALRYLRSIEWSMGHGQCPACYGCTTNKKICDWHQQDESLHRMFDPDGLERVNYRKLGHKEDCKLVAAITDAENILRISDG